MPRAAASARVVIILRGAPRIEGRRLPFPGRFLQDDLDGLLDLSELAVAEPGELHPLLKEGELLFEAPVLAFELRHDLLQARHGLLERPVLARAHRHGCSSTPPNSGAAAGPRPRPPTTEPR